MEFFQIDVFAPEPYTGNPLAVFPDAGSLSAGQNRLGPLTPEARLYGLERVLAMQAQVNEEAARRKRPGTRQGDARRKGRRQRRPATRRKLRLLSSSVWTPEHKRM